MVLSQASRSSPPRIFPEPCFFGIPLFSVFSGDGKVRVGMAAGLLLSACGSADAVSGETGRRMPFGGVRSRRGRSGMCPPRRPYCAAAGKSNAPGLAGPGHRNSGRAGRQRASSRKTALS